MLSCRTPQALLVVHGEDSAVPLGKPKIQYDALYLRLSNDVSSCPQAHQTGPPLTKEPLDIALRTLGERALL